MSKLVVDPHREPTKPVDPIQKALTLKAEINLCITLLRGKFKIPLAGDLDIKKEEEYKNDIKRIRDNYSLEKTSGINYYGKSHIEQFKNFKNSILHKEKVKVNLTDALNTQKLITLLYNNKY